MDNISKARILRTCWPSHYHGNFGDKLTPFILEKNTPYGFKNTSFRNRNRTDIIGIGSCLQGISENYNQIIWTSGFMFQDNYKNFSRAHVIAVRGKETLKRINCINKDKVILGDGGLLCYLLAPLRTKKYKLGIFLHYVDKHNDIIKKIASESNEIFIIHAFCAYCQDIIDRVQECEYIISSSLHGLILADSLNIPNEWIKLSNNIAGNDFKFHDYYSVFDMWNKEPMSIDKNDSLNTILERINQNNYERKNIEKIKSQLFESMYQIEKIRHSIGKT